MNKIVNFIKVFVLVICFLGNGFVYAQIPSDLSKIRSSQITDAQLMQFIQQAQSSGMSEADVIADFQKKGLPDAELQALAARVKGLVGATTGAGNENNQKNVAETVSSKRQYKGESNAQALPTKASRVFGAELFSSADPLFVPNLKIATPKTYVIGPDDELQLDIYGNNISSQKLVVSPDGMVNVKYAGPVNLSGLSIEQAIGVLKARLTKFYPSLSSGATRVQLTLGSMRSIQVMVIGAVKKPGTVTLPSIATLFNALYSSGGPTDNGSFRNIELVRNDKVIATADLYDFILKGDQSSNLSLRDNDVIRVPFAKIQVNLEGALNRTGIFEVKPIESLQHALDFAGGFLSNAFKGRITGSRYTDTERKVIDISKEGFSNFPLQHGDSLSVNTVVERYENRVVITGAVSKPGAYAIEDGMDIKSLIFKAQGVKEDAFLGRANMVRLREDKTKEYKSLNLKNILNGSEKFLLIKEDSLHVVSILELRDRTTITLIGPVKNPGDFRYEDSLTLQAVLLQAGGLMENATASRIEIGRRKQDLDLSRKGLETSEIIQVDIGKDLSQIGADIYLQPFDIINIKVDPEKVKQTSVKLSGEVLYTGNYTLRNPEERLSSVLQRAGGLLPYSDIHGARLIRKTEKIEVVNERADRFISTSFMAIDLSKILDKTKSNEDLILQDGDELIVPKLNNTVSISGSVLRPLTVQFDSRKHFSSYLSAAGGFQNNALRKRTIVIYSNGKSSKSKSFLGFIFYPKLRAGSSIFVPSKKEVRTIDPAKAGVIISSLTAISTIMVFLFK